MLEFNNLNRKEFDSRFSRLCSVLYLALQRIMKLGLYLTMVFLTCFGNECMAQWPSPPPDMPARIVARFNYTETRVANTFDVCLLWSQANGQFTNPRFAGQPSPVAGLAMNWNNNATLINGIGINCWYTSPWGDPDQRGPGFVYCGDGGFSSYPQSPFVVDASTLKCVCPQGSFWYDDVKQCIKTTKLTGTSAPSSKGANLGPPPTPDCNCKAPSEPSLGEPINPSTGNMWHVETDFVDDAPGGLELKRVYNSTPVSLEAKIPHSFGMRWTQKYDASLRQEIRSTAADGTNGIICWRREDNKFTWCESALQPPISANPSAVSISRGDGKRYFFNLTNGVWVGDADTNDRVTAQYDSTGTAIVGWTYVSADNDSVERYSANGALVSITTRSGLTQKLTYSSGTSNDSTSSRYPADAPICSNAQQGDVLPAGRLLCVTDQWGRQLQFEYDIAGRVKKMLDPKGQSYVYEYDGPSGGCQIFDASNPNCVANNLTKVTYPDENSRVYVYKEAAQINNGTACFPNSTGVGRDFFLNTLTGLIDENGQRYVSWTYDCSGRATSSQLGDGANKVTLTYPTSTSQTVTHYTGPLSSPQITSVNLTSEVILNVAKNALMNAPCAECGAFKQRVHDTNTNVIAVTDWNGISKCYQYDLARNLEIARIEGITFACSSGLWSASSLSAPARKISTKWHSTYRLPVAIAEPKKLTTFTYDNSGNLLTKTEHTTSDISGTLGFSAQVTGTPRTRTYTYNSTGQLLTSTGPRVDVLDQTTYEYDGLGNLSSIKNALGQITSFSNYDENGHVGRIVAPNGSVTTLTYSPRGKITNISIEADGVTETTRYEYDSAGQLSKITTSDGATLSYTYDTAHRLTAIADEKGNTITYTLDIRGNRTAEQVTDPNGVLARRISRVFDANDRVTSLIGGMR